MRNKELPYLEGRRVPGQVINYEVKLRRRPIIMLLLVNGAFNAFNAANAALAHVHEITSKALTLVT